MAYVRTVKTSSGATAVQIVWSTRRGSRQIEHLGSAHDDGEWCDKHAGEEISDGQVFTQPWPATRSEKARGIPDRIVYYQYRHDRARRTLRGIDEQVTKAQRAVDGHAPVKRNRFIKLTGATKSVNRELRAKARGLAGLKGYTINLTTVGAEFVVDAYHQLWRIEKSFRMSKHDLQARPVYHHKRESIEPT